MERSAPQRLNGILVVDKPAGITSHDVVQRIRRRLKIRRVGHAGTLDPMATGILVVAVGEATRIVEFLMAGEKTYRAVVKLGEITDTQDAEGKVLAQRPVEGVGRAEIETACAAFTGQIRQVPPMYSALKKNGVSLHRLARQGIEVERDSREVEIHRLTITSIDLPHVHLEIDCSKGTYIRTLAHDLGTSLGPGAHLSALRRVRSGSFSEADCVELAALESADGSAAAALLPIREALSQFRELAANDAAARRLANGVPPQLAEIESGLPAAEGEIVLLVHRENLLAIARFAPERLQEKRGDFELLRVFPPEQADR